MNKLSQMIMNKYFNLITLVSTIALIVSSCGGSNGNGKENVEDEFTVSGVVLPASVSVEKGGTITLQVMVGKGPKTTDVVILKSSSEIETRCVISSASESEFSFAVPGDFSSGYYTLLIERGSVRKQVGKTTISLVSGTSITPSAGATVYGLVECDGVGVPNVVVSDGIEVVKTDSKGVYNIKSSKKWGYVFVSIPSGYQVASDGVLPQFHQSLSQDSGVAERVDFPLNKADAGDDFSVVVMGDIHLAGRSTTYDQRQFYSVCDGINDYMTTHKGTKFYGLTLGDMTWDVYWYSNSYFFPQYLADVNSKFSGLQIFHTMGNHDNDMEAAGDFNTATKYVRDIAPTYYSFNIGKCHFMVLDDILCTNSGAGTSESRTYKTSVTDEQLDWIAKDLSFVDKSAPVIVTAHAPFYAPAGVTSFGANLSNTEAVVSLFSGYSVHFFTGHKHINYNVDYTASSGVFEHNVAAICGSWWWSYRLTPGHHICTDGTPGGFEVLNITGNKIDWLYVGTDNGADYQFRGYDLNNVSFSLNDVPNMPEKFDDEFSKYTKAYPLNSNNEVLVNVFNWDPNWTITITDKETGANLPTTQVMTYDPLHIAALTVKRYNSSSLTDTPSFITTISSHFFKAQAPNSTDDLSITVKDEFGHTFSQTMVRPKAFSTDAYLKE